MRKLVVILLTAAICLSLVTIPAAAASSDRATVAASALNMMGALQGDGSGSLNLDGTLTRAQFCKIAVVALGLSESVGQYAGYTIFPDVPSTSWAAGYVNLAVRSAGIMSGYMNGCFGPGDIITYGQAVTVLIRMLGYTSSEIGTNWPDSYLSKADEIGLTSGVKLSASDTITRGNAAVLFVNLFNTCIKGTTKKFMETISGATVTSGVFLMTSNATTDDGTTGAVKIAGAKSGVYLPDHTVPDTLVGTYGSLVLDAAGKALMFVPAATGRTVVSTVSSAIDGAITCADGTKITMTSTASFYLNDDAATYADSWVDLNGGMLVSAYYSDGGAVQCVLVASSESEAGSVTVVTTDSYTLPSSSSVYINGNAATAADIEKYDVISDNGTGLYNVTRSRVSGCCEEAYPSTSSPKTIKVLGKEFTVLDSARSSLGSFAVGDTVTLLLTSDNQVAGLFTGWASGNTNYGVVTSLSSSSASVRLSNGVTVTGSLGSSVTGLSTGSLVTVSSDKTGLLYISAVTAASSSYALTLTAGTLGNLSLSKAVKFYECVGNSVAVEIKQGDISVSTIDSSKIRFYATDLAGRVSLLLLDDVTGAAYTYGFIKNGSVTQTVGSLSATNLTTCVTNGDGTTATLVGGTGLSDGTPAGIAATGSGTLAGYVKLTAMTGVSRSSFQSDSDGTLYLKTSSGLMPVSDDVQAYLSSSAAWTTITRARSYSDNLTVYFDKTPTTGGKVRIVIAD